ncbi:DinB family protein [Flavobacterium columnare]|uniref:DinB-like domain-containing protein n=3 Tax=Flavobacterium columnare TaxID=996 RepID=G8X904_FLACA|nr:DinB family protein [Flavobacterium columnare]AEW87237.1 hypothetical protein FCOL_12180 [Flavobacterium columnare ATCC 49512]AMO21382.2 DinB family protein [Flavobacterium columnare]ANO48049.1 hypothetical protein Pf1_02595 [Flavobacterium columnare]APT21376.1 hypothetical protein BU993_01220 [Flavobacterium columnare]AUX17052.1 hypothetical protein AQ623_01030 [Flavobacterium columnare]
MNNPFIYENAPAYFHSFFDLIESDHLVEELEKSKNFTLALIDSITPEIENFAYAPDKWTTKEVLIHIIDAERILTYRALRFSRFDATELTGFDQNKYIQNLKSVNYKVSDLREDYINVRNATISLYKSMTEEMLDFKGVTNPIILTARSLGFMVVGHNIHHAQVIQKKYSTVSSNL